MKLRVYIDARLKHEAGITPADAHALRIDQGRIVCGAQIPEGRRVVTDLSRKRVGRRIVRVDLYTEPDNG